MKNSDKPINPIANSSGFISHQSTLENKTHQQFLTGLSKREYFAGLAMQGMMANRWTMELGSYSDEMIITQLNEGK